MEKLDIISIGESLIELSSEKSLTYSDTLDKYYGGDTLVSAIAALRMGSKVGYITRVGMDHFKDFLLDSWQAEGLDISQIKLIEGFNGLYFIARPTGSEKEFAYYRKKTAATNLSIDDISAEYIQNAGIVYSTGVTQSLSLSAKEAVNKAFTIAKQNNVMTAYDPNYAPKLWSKEEAKQAFEEVQDNIDILFLNLKYDSEKLLEICSIDKLMKYFWDRGVSIIVVKSHAEKGYYTGYQGEVLFTEFYADTIVDTTSAGDAFNGGFMHGIASGLTPFESAHIAAIVAGLQSQGIGAIKSIPFKKDVYSIYKGNHE
ncbi:MAG: sugar kinase [Candidatus Gastranaerophilales bacterium]|nr:sugar kinase [Candidatus Gastranaerophilales bacterium]